MKRPAPLLKPSLLHTANYISKAVSCFPFSSEVLFDGIIVSRKAGGGVKHVRAEQKVMTFTNNANYAAAVRGKLQVSLPI